MSWSLIMSIVQIPLNIRNTHATYETQFGYVQRPTHKNTTWDIAQFEVCGHKVKQCILVPSARRLTPLQFADLSEYGYGVALLSESKYGFSCIGNVLSMSLLRAATAPDAEQDQGKVLILLRRSIADRLHKGEHTFSWAVLPHVGNFHESDVPIAGHIFNSPFRCEHSLSRHLPYGVILSTHSVAPGLVAQGFEADLQSIVRPPIAGGAPNVIIETLKRGENDDLSDASRSTFVFRLYEAFGGHARSKFALRDRGFKIEKVAVTNLLEDELEVLERDESGAVTLDFHGFEVKTVKVTVKHLR
jgi:alpha-mannosidase